MDYLIIFVIFCLGFVIGKLYAEYRLIKLLKDSLNEIGIDLDAEIEKYDENKKAAEKGLQVRKLVVEKANDMLYLYDRDNNDFVCQALSLDELATKAKQYKNISHAVVVHDNKVFMFMDGSSQEYVK
jgi:hypothetical protein